MDPVNKKNEYAKVVCYFLAEMLRTHRISLNRAAEISQKMIENLSLLDSEQDFLRLTKTLAADFEELIHLQEIISVDIQALHRKKMEEAVREFVINILPSDSQMALSVLEEAVKEDSKLEELGQKFPQFDKFITKAA